MTEIELRRFTDAVERLVGIRVADRAAAMADLLERRATAHPSVAAYLSLLDQADPAEVRTLATEVTVGETYFFRHAEQCHAFADLVVQQEPVRILSAGCSTGEEPYTLAMIVRELAPRDADHVTIAGFDLNPNSLARARRARYSRWSLRATSDVRQQRWFTPAGKDVDVVPEIRHAVQFSEGSLHAAGTWNRDPWDVIFCRNVLMYFSPERCDAAIGRLVDALLPGGYLFLGHAETLRDRMHGLELCHSHGTFYYRKGTRAAITQVQSDEAWVGSIAAASERVKSLVETALQREPATAVDELALAPIAMLIGEERFAEATDALDRLPAAYETKLHRAIIAAHTGQGLVAETTCRNLLIDNPDDARVHYLLSVCRAAANDPLGAEHHASTALRLEPRFAMACVQLAFMAKRTLGARPLLERAIDLIATEHPTRLALFAGGFSRESLTAMCRAQLKGLP
ncbi:MAG: CheR family methyltransferase [Kofleriaceae bacterium]